MSTKLRTIQVLAVGLALLVSLVAPGSRAAIPDDAVRIDRYSFGDRTQGIVYGKDGTLGVFLQHAEPTDPKERANWLPAPAGRFYLVTRHYSPQAPILTGDWVPPAITKR